MPWIVYCHTLISDGRRYVGLTSQTVEKRWKNHVHIAKSSKGGRWHFPNAIRKYGKDAFSHEVLGTFDSLQDANTFEKTKILELDLRNPEKGFNLAEGGNHVPHPIRNPWNDELRKKASESAKARWNDPTIRAKNLAATKAAINTPESRVKRSMSSKKAMARPEVKEKRSQAAKAVHAQSGFKEKMSRALSGRVFTPEHRSNMAASQTGKVTSPDTITKISNSTKSMWQDPAYRERMSNQSKSLWQDPEYRAAQKGQDI